MQLIKPFFATWVLFIFSICIFAQSSEYPNELPGYKFFGNGKLNGLHLLASSKDDVKRVFGEKCEKQCNYDADWSISFKYFEDTWVTDRRNENGEKQTFLLDSKYLGKLRSIEIRPKRSISFINVSFPDIFQKILAVALADGQSGKSSMSVNNGFEDSKGLSYQIYSHTNYDDFKNKKTRSYCTGDLVLIRYEITAEAKQNLFVLKN